MTAFISLVTVVKDHQPLEMGLIGNEGMLGSSLSLGIPSAPMRALVQGSGKALRISAIQMRRELHAAPALVNQLTHEFLADMLGVRRSSITVAAGALQAQHIIRYTRGEIMILDRKGLEAAACECYKMVIQDYEQVFA